MTAQTSAFSKNSVSTTLAHELLHAAERKATELGQPSAVAVLDDSGVLKAFVRMDGAPLIAVQVAQDKAYTAAGLGVTTHGFHDFIKDDPPLAAGAPTGMDRLILFGGGFPIVVDGQLVGGIGVAGGHWSTDVQIAEAALAGIGNTGTSQT